MSDDDLLDEIEEARGWVRFEYGRVQSAEPGLLATREAALAVLTDEARSRGLDVPPARP